MKRSVVMVLFGLLCAAGAFGQSPGSSADVIRRNATITTNTTMVTTKFTSTPVAPVTVALSFVGATNGIVSLGITMAGSYHSLGSVSVTNEAIVQLPLVWLRPDASDSLTVVNSNGAPLKVTVDFKH